MNLEIQSAKLVLSLVDPETGEIITKEATLGDFKDKKPSTRKSSKSKDNDPTPKLIVLDNKWQLNNAAIELTGFEPEDKLDIRFEKVGKTFTPILCKDEKKGNRLTKSFTVSCRGQKRDGIVKYGEMFEIVQREDGLFKLINPDKEEIEVEDDIIEVPEVEEEEVLDIDLNNIDFSFD